MKINNHLIVKKMSYGILLLAVISKTIKGKLGFNMDTPDAKFLVNSQAIVTALTNNVNGFYLPVFSKLLILTSQNVVLSKAIALAKQGGLGLEAAKNVAKKKVYSTLLSCLGYINELCRDNQIDAVSIITGATMIVVAEKKVNKQDFAVQFGDATGEVILISLAVKIGPKYVTAIYMWQFSIDNGKTWEDLEPTLTAHTVATGMLVNITTLFRKRTKTTQLGMTDWCPPLEITPQ